jgi:hypothetical protein
MMHKGIWFLATTVSLLVPADLDAGFRLLISIFMVALVIFAIISGLLWQFGRSGSLLTKWAAENGYRIIRQEFRFFRKGPFFWTSTRGQAVYYVVIEDSAGNKRKGWVRCGSWWFGLLSNNVEVRWDE